MMLAALAAASPSTTSTPTWAVVLLGLLGGGFGGSLLNTFIRNRHDKDEGEQLRQHEREENRGEHEHERQLAQDARIYDARSRVYLELLTYLRRLLHRIEQTHPLLTIVPVNRERDGGADEPGLPDNDFDGDPLAFEAEIAAFGSQAVLDALDTFTQTARMFFFDIGIVETLRNQGERGQPMADATKQVQTTRADAREQFMALERLVRDELATPGGVVT